MGDNLKDGGSVLGILLTESNNIDMYDYKGIYVSGDHLLKENGKWIN